MIAIKPTYWRQGYGLDSTRCMVNFAFEHNIAQKIMATVHEANCASQKFLEKLGYVKTGYAHMESRNVFVYMLFRDNWKRNHRLIGELRRRVTSLMEQPI